MRAVRVVLAWLRNLKARAAKSELSMVDPVAHVYRKAGERASTVRVMVFF